MPKARLASLWDSLEGKFNKFVADDTNDAPNKKQQTESNRQNQQRLLVHSLTLVAQLSRPQMEKYQREAHLLQTSELQTLINDDPQPQPLFLKNRCSDTIEGHLLLELV